MGIGILVFQTWEMTIKISLSMVLQKHIADKQVFSMTNRYFVGHYKDFYKILKKGFIEIFSLLNYSRRMDMKKLLVSMMLFGLISNATLKAEEWWLLDANKVECTVPPKIGGYTATPRVILETFKGCKMEALDNNAEIVMVSCTGELNTNLIYTTSFKACNKAKQVLSKRKQK
jgi:hypothetical protein